MYQDNFYSKTESNSYFNRWKKEINVFNDSKINLRESKIEILNSLEKHYDLKDKKILEDLWRTENPPWKVWE